MLSGLLLAARGVFGAAAVLQDRCPNPEGVFDGTENQSPGLEVTEN